MIFNTWVYGLFLLVSFSVYWLTPAGWRPQLLIVCGIYFYWYYYPVHTILIAAMTGLVFAISRLVPPAAGRQRRLWFTISVAGCLGTLAYFKYQGFLFDSIAWFL